MIEDLKNFDNFMQKTIENMHKERSSSTIFPDPKCKPAKPKYPN